MLFVESTGLEVAAVPRDINGVATSGIWISLKNFNRASFLVAQGAWAGGTPAVTLQQATDIYGAGAKALGILSYLSKAGLTASKWAKSAVVGNTFNLTATANLFTAIEINTEDLDVNGGFSFVRVQVASPGAFSDFLGVAYLLGEPRFCGTGITMPDAKIGNAGGFEAETIAWIAAVAVAGGTLSTATKAAANAFVISAKGNGYFSKLLRCNLLCGDFAASKVPLIKTVGAATDAFNNFLAGDYVETGATGGLTGNGATKWIDPGAVANAGSITPASCHLAYYATVASVTGVDCPMGRDVSGTDAFSIFAFTGPLQAQGLIGNTSPAAKLGTGKGFMIANSLTNLAQYFNGGRRRFTPDVAVGGTIPSTSMAVFSHNAGANCWGGRMNSYSWGLGLTYAEAGLFTDDMETFQAALGRQFTPPGASISCWGDSLTFGYTATNSFPQYLLSNYGSREVFNGGVPGETGAQIYTRMLADPRNCTGVVVIYAGYNDIGTLTRAQIVAKTVQMVGACGTIRFVILSIPNGEAANQYNTGGLYSDIVGTFTDLVALYPNNTLDMRAHLVSLHTGSAQDLIDFGNDIVPVSLRNDFIHLNNAGNDAIGARLKTFIDGKGW